MDFASILSAEYADAMLKKARLKTWTRPIGTGPYVLQQYKVDSLIRYVANPNYWEGEVPTKHLIFSITPNVETRTAKLQTNECQIVPAPSPVQFDAIKNNKDLTLHAVDALNVGYLAFNTEKNRLITCWCVRRSTTRPTRRPSLMRSLWDRARWQNRRSRQICWASIKT